jgi:DNA-binding SARP family transcriptional activator/tetratricopeptide (TPR) repeat protein
MMFPPMLRLLTFGGLALERHDASPPPRLRPQRLAILAVLASAGERGVSRERMSGLFWADADEERARHSLRQALYALRQELGAEVVRSDVVLSLDRAAISSDVGDFRAALAAGDRARAAGLVRGAFLDGFYLSGAEEFERWMEEQRNSLTAEATRVVLALTKEAEVSSDHDAAVEWWRRLTILDPLSGRFALGYLKALAGGGDRAGALAFARAHESVVRRELEADADPEIRRLEAELRAIPSPAVVRIAPAKSSERAGFGGPTESAPDATTPDRPAPDPATRDTSSPPAIVGTTWRSRKRQLTVVAGAALAVLAFAALATTDRWDRASGHASGVSPTFAVGMIREEGVPDTLRIGGVLTDMLATNLARVAGLTVLANARLFELMRPGQDTLSSGYYEAARRAGANEIFQGRLLAGPQWSMAMEIQRVDLKTGIVKSGYRVAATDRYALIDSMTAAIARDLHLGSPSGSVSEVTTESPMAYRLYEEGLRAYHQYDEAAARRLMQAALEEDSTFAMAAYYDAVLEPNDKIQKRERALRLAARAPERERLQITAEMRMLNNEPVAVALVESLTTKYPNDPRALELASRTLAYHGSRPQAVAAIERAIALDSASEPIERQSCRLCADLGNLAEIYLWWDSLGAAERTAHRFLRLRPASHGGWGILVRVAAARGDTTATRLYIKRFHKANPLETSPGYLARRSILVEDYARAARDLAPFANSPRPDDLDEAFWLQSIALRGQGRLDEAVKLARLRLASGDLGNAMIALETGNFRAAVSAFAFRNRSDESPWPPAVQARQMTWKKTLLGMALAAAGDTLAVRRLADTVEYWGKRSLYGRDPRIHHYLRGMLLVAQRRDAEAAAELRLGMDSPSYGFTRINYELGRTLMRLNRPAEAVPVVRAALHGDIDASNLYMTRTDLHELLAQAFDSLRTRDSAAVHYRAVLKAWEHADPLYHARRERARVALARNVRGAF